MARGKSPLACAQARALRALSADAPPPAASPETSFSVMTQASDAHETGGGPSSVAGTTEASVPALHPLHPLVVLVVVCQSRSSASDGAVLGLTLGAASRSAADAPEAAPGVRPADSQPQGSVSSSGTPDDGTCAAVDAPEASFAVLGSPRVSSVRWEDIEDIVTAGTNRTVQQVQGSSQSYFLALARLVVALNHRPPLRTNYEVDRRLEAAKSLLDMVDALAPVSRSPDPWEDDISELRDDVAS
ncbi:unnamed protein product [Phytophthora fragariaefolia]|uniref:Unnamed protein product n=1 Tax=Phytophthora fragariaefolia TaxID=1490495 RepID=A0A9W6XN34_9STRA|nr:unnamed protein product [Phytophthora fragariaefolia]